MTVSAESVKKLREMTGAGMMDCKHALGEAKGDFDKAVQLLRQKGLAGLQKKAGRLAKEGIIDSYIHARGKIATLVEINCETDFVARNEEFRSFAHDMAMQVAATKPAYVSREDVPPELLREEMELYREGAKKEGKPEQVIDKIVDGKIEKFYEAVCLIDQPYIKDQDKRVKDYLAEIAGKIGENIVIRRFVRFELGATVSE